MARSSDTIAARQGLNGSGGALRYDTVTIRLHWATTALVALQWLGAELSDDLFGRAGHDLYWSIHITLGVLLTIVLAVHLWWRITHGVRLPDANSGQWTTASRTMLALLTGLPILIVLLGFGIVFAHGWTIFGILTIPPASSRHIARTVHGIHEWCAHILVVLAVGHAAAALVHHHLRRDDVLKRIVPRWIAEGS